MVQTLQARTATLEDLRSHFGLQLTTSYQFFSGFAYPQSARGVSKPLQ